MSSPRSGDEVVDSATGVHGVIIAPAGNGWVRVRWPRIDWHNEDAAIVDGCQLKAAGPGKWMLEPGGRQ